MHVLACNIYLVNTFFHFLTARSRQVEYCVLALSLFTEAEARYDD